MRPLYQRCRQKVLHINLLQTSVNNENRFQILSILSELFKVLHFTSTNRLSKILEKLNYYYDFVNNGSVY